MSSLPSVAVVIPSWNSADLLPACVASLRAQNVPLELFVVDNGSRDASVDYLEREGIPHLALPENVGFASAVNLGVARTAAPFVLALNADTVLEPGAVAALLAAIAADQRLGGVQPRIVQLEPGGERELGPATRLYSAGQALTRDGRAVELGAGRPLSAAPTAVREIFGVCGAACLLRRELFEPPLGGYDERYFAFYEDVDLNVRARVFGWSFQEVPEAVVWHLGNASWQAGFERPGADNARLVARNRLATQLKFLPPGALPRVLAVEAGSLLRAARQRRFLATLGGKLAALRRLPALLGERRRLHELGAPELARRWLGRGTGLG